MGSKHRSKGLAIGWRTVLAMILVVLILAVMTGVTKFIPALGETINNLIKGGGTLDISDTELGKALMCAHWRCKVGCSSDYVESNPADCPCEEEWDVNKDGRICGSESRAHAIKLLSKEDVTVTKDWWKLKACETKICDRVILDKQDCELNLGSALNGIAFTDETTAGIKCGDDDPTLQGYGSCIVPPDTWYIWAKKALLSNTAVHTYVCDERPSEILSCAAECAVRGGSVQNDGCGAADYSDPSCDVINDKCTYYEDIGDIYCSDTENCYCRFQDDCECADYETQQCTETGCGTVLARSFACCKFRDEPYQWMRYDDCPETNRYDQSDCDPPYNCQEYCDSLEYKDSVYVDSTKECMCSRVECESYLNADECESGGCRWCDKCQERRVLEDEDKRDKCIEMSERCGIYTCMKDTEGDLCGGECSYEGNECGFNQGCTYDCACVDYVCCENDYGFVGCVQEDTCLSMPFNPTYYEGCSPDPYEYEMWPCSGDPYGE